MYYHAWHARIRITIIIDNTMTAIQEQDFQVGDLDLEGLLLDAKDDGRYDLPNKERAGFLDENRGFGPVVCSTGKG